MRYRVKFQKYGVMKFVGHLDIMRYFQKAFRRAALPIRYSEGFNPHQIMSFAAPLGVGITSDGEYMDVDMKEEVLSEDTLQKLDSVMVDGMKILEFRALNDSAKKAMTAVRAASYLLYYKEDIFLSKEDLQSKLAAFYGRPEILIIKMTKKSERELDLKPLIFSFEVVELPEVLREESAYSFGLKLCVSTGSTDNIKPELVMEHFHKSAGLEDVSFGIHRVDLYTFDDNEELISLGDVGYDVQ
ncbi:MAG: DUF2344 domain-containing protein [Lachnospiraceae bacterium]|nr:DUF2344 domain-containing protein [Lachnospiraceae bacterium]